MAVVQWQSLLSQLQLVGSRAYKCSEVGLSNFEAAHFPLPESFRTFCAVFGPGFLCDNFYVGCPDYRGSDENLQIHYDLESLCRSVRVACAEFEEIGTEVERFQRAWFFCRDYASAYFYWDPTEVTVSEFNEYGIYMVDRDFRTTRVADTFFGFVKDVCLSDSQHLFEQPPSQTFRFAP